MTRGFRVARCPWQTEVGTFGTEIGLKDANVHSDLLETLLYRCQIRPDAKVR